MSAPLPEDTRGSEAYTRKILSEEKRVQILFVNKSGSSHWFAASSLFLLFSVQVVVLPFVKEMEYSTHEPVYDEFDLLVKVIPQILSFLLVIFYRSLLIMDCLTSFSHPPHLEMKFIILCLF